MEANQVICGVLVTLAVCCASSVASFPTGSLSASYTNDMSKPTMGLQGESQSDVHYDQTGGLQLKGGVSDLLGPPIKIANGYNNYLKGSEEKMLGGGIKAGSALLGIDSKELEALGGLKMLKGGALVGSAIAKTAKATAIGGKPGKIISSIIELPVKIVGMKELGAGKAIAGLGKAEGLLAGVGKAKGTAMVIDGEQHKVNGINQMLDGATEGLTNIGNAVQKSTNNAATALRFLPLIMNQAIPQGAAPQEQQQITQQTESGTKSANNASPQPMNAMSALTSPLTGGTGSLFGGLLPSFDMGASPPPSAHAPFAAAISSSSPFANILTNPSLNPLLYPMSTFQSNIYNRQSVDATPSKLNKFSANLQQNGLNNIGHQSSNVHQQQQQQQQSQQLEATKTSA